MESIFFDVYLFCIVYGFLLWLITPEKKQTIKIYSEKKLTNTHETEQPFSNEDISDGNVDNQNINSQFLSDNSENDLSEVTQIQEINRTDDIFDISTIKIYKYRGFQMIKITDLPKEIMIPTGTKIYKMRGHKAIKLTALTS